MNIHESDLLQLIMLHEGRLDPPAADSLRGRIESDERLRKRWRKIRRVFQMSIGGGRRGSEFNGNGVVDSVVDSTWIAALVDQQVSAERAQVIERAIWKSECAIGELINELRFREQVSIHPVPARLSERVSRMLNSASASEPGTDVVNVDSALLPDAASRNRGNRTGWQASAWSIAALVVAATVLVGCTVFAVYQWSRPVDNLVDPAKPGDGATDRMLPPLPDRRVDDLAKGKQDGRESDLPETRLPDTKQEPPQPLVVNRQDEQLDDQFKAWVAEQKPSIGLEPDGVEEFPAIEWEQVKGLLAIRNRRTESYVGYLYPGTRTGDDYFTTLPKSWVRGSIENVGDVVINESSSFLVSRSRRPRKDLAKIRVDYGQVAFQNLNRSNDYQFSVGDQKFPLEILEDRTTVAVDATIAGRPRLMIQRGKVRMQDRELGRGLQVTYSADAGMQVGTTDTGLGWISRSPPTVTLDAKTRQQFAGSGDLIADFLASDIRFSGKRNLVEKVDWVLSLEPERIAGLLENEESSLQLAAVEWLLKQRLDNLIGRRAWVTVARRTHGPSQIRQIYQWVSFIESNQALPPRAMTEKLIEMLNHKQFMIRLLSGFALAEVFGNPARYQPAAQPAARARATRAWAESIMRAYQQQRANPLPRNRDQRENARKNR